MDKGVEELSSFEDLVTESCHASPPWQVVFVAGLPGLDGQPPTAEMVDGALDAMVEGVRTGNFGGFLALDPAGEPLSFC